jgi:hypothetical protein
MTCRALIVIAVLVVLASGALGEEQIDFESQIQPIFIEHCAECHGKAKNLGKMRLNTAAAIREKWEADEHLLVAGNPAGSELYQRLTLPADDRKRMPKGADPLPKETIALIAKWIEQGATLPSAAVAEPSQEPVESAEPEELALPEVAPAPQEAIDRLEAVGAHVTPLFAGSPLLEVSFAQRSEPAGDAEVLLLAGVAHQVYALNLAESHVSDAGMALLAALKNVSRLHLEQSKVTDAGLAHLGSLDRLEYLNLYGTQITDAGLAHLSELKHLRHLYLWQTKVSYEAAMALEGEIPGLVVNLGFDHPAVVRGRLTKELELSKQRADEAKADAERAQQLLESSEQNMENLQARIVEIEEELQRLDNQTDGGVQGLDVNTPTETGNR